MLGPLECMANTLLNHLPKLFHAFCSLITQWVLKHSPEISSYWSKFLKPTTKLAPRPLVAVSKGLNSQRGRSKAQAWDPPGHPVPGRPHTSHRLFAFLCLHSMLGCFHRQLEVSLQCNQTTTYPESILILSGVAPSWHLLLGESKLKWRTSNESLKIQESMGCQKGLADQGKLPPSLMTWVTPLSSDCHSSIQHMCAASHIHK